MFVFCVLCKGKQMLAAGIAENPIAPHFLILQERLFALDVSSRHELWRIITPEYVP